MVVNFSISINFIIIFYVLIRWIPIERISSGKKITKASDSPSELAVLAALQAQTRSITQQISNGMSEISMLQTAEGALDSTSQSLQRMSELSVQAANGTLTDSDRSAIMAEIKELSAGIDKTTSSTSLTAKNPTALFQLRDRWQGIFSGALMLHHWAYRKFRLPTEQTSKAIESVNQPLISVFFGDQIGATVNELTQKYLTIKHV